MAEALTEIDLKNQDNHPPRGVFLTKICRKEYEQLDGRTKAFLTETMKTWAWAKDKKFEPQPSKFKRLGKEKTGRSTPPHDVNVCEFKYKTVRVYGHETSVSMREAIVLVSVTGNDKGGQTQKKQDASIRTAAERAGGLYE